MGALLAQLDDGPDPVPADPVTGRPFDTNYTVANPAAGSYTAMIKQYDNFAAGSNLADGFQKTSATFTSGFGCSNGQFCDFTGANRTNKWAFDILGVEGAVEVDPNPIPLPATLPLIAAALRGLSLFERRRS